MALLLVAGSSSAQPVVGECEALVPSSPEGAGGGAGACFTDPLHYEPDQYTYNYKIKVNFHFMQDGTGGGSFTATDNGLGYPWSGQDYIDSLLHYANGRLSYNQPMNLLQGNNTAVLDRKYSLVNAGVYYRNNLSHYQSSTGLNTLSSTYGVNTGSEINVFFLAEGVGPCAGTWGAAYVPGSTLKMNGMWQDYMYEHEQRSEPSSLLGQSSSIDP